MRFSVFKRNFNCARSSEFSSTFKSIYLNVNSHYRVSTRIPRFTSGLEAFHVDDGIFGRLDRCVGNSRNLICDGAVKH